MGGTSCSSTNRPVASVSWSTWATEIDSTRGGRAKATCAAELRFAQHRADLRQPRAAAAQVDAPGQHARLRELLEHQLHPRCPNGYVLANDPLNFVALLDGDSLGEVDLDLLGAREGQLQAIGERLGEGPPAEREHARALDATRPHESNVGGAATDVDEQPAGLLDLLVVHAARDGVGLGDDGHEVEVEHARHGLQRAQVDERRDTH